MRRGLTYTRFSITVQYCCKDVNTSTRACEAVLNQQLLAELDLPVESQKVGRA
jgi:hypothetical protein